MSTIEIALNETQTTRTGTLLAPNATGSGFVRLLVRELSDGSIEYLVGDTAHRPDGWAELPVPLVGAVDWR